MTHLPFRSRCRHCVRGRGKEEDCRRTVTEERYVPGAHVDNMFMGGEKGSALALIVVREDDEKAVSSTVVPRTSTGERIHGKLTAWHSKN